jgi:hypothetical protein
MIFFILNMYFLYYLKLIQNKMQHTSESKISLKRPRDESMQIPTIACPKQAIICSRKIPWYIPIPGIPKEESEKLQDTWRKNRMSAAKRLSSSAERLSSSAELLSSSAERLSSSAKRLSSSAERLSSSAESSFVAAYSISVINSGADDTQGLMLRILLPPNHCFVAPSSVPPSAPPSAPPSVPPSVPSSVPPSAPPSAPCKCEPSEFSKELLEEFDLFDFSKEFDPLDLSSDCVLDGLYSEIDLFDTVNENTSYNQPKEVPNEFDSFLEDF